MKNRIYIFTQKQVCKICLHNCADFDGIAPDCDVCAYKELPHMTKQKAAKIICDKIIDPRTWPDKADAALNGLLEATK